MNDLGKTPSEKSKEVTLPPRPEVQAMPFLDPSEKGGLKAYLRGIHAVPILGKEEEVKLAQAWRERNDLEAAHRLVTSHLRLVAKMAVQYKGYGLAMPDMISEGNIGLMQAVKRFNPDKGFRLSTYAIWWIRATIQEYILKSWSLVRIGKTSSQKKLFFNLRRLKEDIQRFDGTLSSLEASVLARRMGIDKNDVVVMDRALTYHDQSLNAPLRGDTGEEWIGTMVDQAALSQQSVLEDSEEKQGLCRQLKKALKALSPREQEIVRARKLKEPVETLQVLSTRFGISRERVRQIEQEALKKLQHHIVIQD